MREGALRISGGTVVAATGTACACRTGVFLVALSAASVGMAHAQPTASSHPPAQPPASSPPSTPTDSEVGGRLVITEETVVVGVHPDEPARESSIATKTSTPLRETPRSVSITDRRTLDDRQTIALSDAHDYTVGVIPADERGPAAARGFRLGFYDIRRDGLRTYAWSIREPVAIERVQYLHGPAGVLYGDGSPGGLINLVLKKPLPARRTEVTASAGTLGFGRATGDTTGPVGRDTSWRYRVIGAGEWLDNGYANDERRLSLFPMLSGDVADGVTLHVDGELYHQQGRAYQHVVPSTPATQRGDFSQVPWTANVASPDDRWSGWNVSPGVRLDARLGGTTSLHGSARFTRIRGDLDIHGLSGLDADGRTARRFQYEEHSVWDEWQSDVFTSTDATTGRVSHRIVAGVEAGLSTTDSAIGSAAGADLDLATSTYGTDVDVPTLRPTRYGIRRFGVYVQDQVRLAAPVVLVPSLRWSQLNIDDRIPTSTGTTTQDAISTAVSPGLGIVVLPRSWLSLYATVTTGFEPPGPGQYLEDGRPLAPSDSRLLETGVRTELLRGHLSWSTSLFQITQTNVAEAMTQGIYRQIGEGTSHGVETEVTGRLTAGLGVTAGYAWTDTDITRDTSGFVGNALPNAPAHKANAWFRYRFTGGALRGLMLASGVIYVSDRYVARNNVVIAPAYTRLDLSGAWDLRSAPLRLGLVMTNVTNTRYVMGGAGAVLYAGPPRRLAVQVTARF